MRRPLIRSIATTVVAAVALVSCSSDGDGFEPGASVPGADTSAATTSNTAPFATTPATESPSTAEPADTTATTEPPPTTTEPPNTNEPSPTTTEEAPSTSAGPELAATPQSPGFDFPPADLQTDPDSPNNNREIRPDDQPILDAYLKATEAQNLALSEWPLDPDHPLLLAAPFTEAALALFDGGLASRTASNQVLDVSGGLTSRPYVLEGDGDPERAIVWDCQIDATFWKDVDTGEKAPPDAFPNAGPPGVEAGTETVLVLVNGEWLVDSGAVEERACS